MEKRASTPLIPMSIENVQIRIAQIRQLSGFVAPVAPPSRPSATGTSFALALDNAMQTGAATSTSPNTIGAPPELARYGNGRIPPAALESVGMKDHRMWIPAAQSLKRLVSDAAAAGVTIGITDSYRTYDQQVEIARRKGLYKNGGLAAVPGTSSHGWGRSVDLDISPEGQAWLREHAGDYGFIEDVPREPWHWTYQANS